MWPVAVGPSDMQVATGPCISPSWYCGLLARDAATVQYAARGDVMGWNSRDGAWHDGNMADVAR